MVDAARYVYGKVYCGRDDIEEPDRRRRGPREIPPRAGRRRRAPLTLRLDATIATAVADSGPS